MAGSVRTIRNHGEGPPRGVEAGPAGGLIVNKAGNGKGVAYRQGVRDG